MSSRSKRPWRDVHFHKNVLPTVLAGLKAAGFKHMNDVKDAKAYVSSLFLVKPMVDPRSGEAQDIVYRTNWLTEDEYEAFIGQVTEYAASELGIYVNEQDERQGINLLDDEDFYTTVEHGF